MIRADRVVFATPGLRSRYAERYPSRADRFVTITNGYDRAELGEAAPPPERAAGPFRLVYAGSVYGEHELRIFLDGLAQALERRPDLAHRLRVEFIGWMSIPNWRLAHERQASLGPVLKLAGFMAHAETLARVRAADAALTIIAAGPGRDVIIGSKLFEYIGLDRPVLAIVPPGDARLLLAELDWGVVADPEPGSVADALIRLVGAPSPSRRADPTGRYERSRLAARLAKVLTEAAGDDGESRPA